MLLSIIVFILVLSILVFVHELGHFMVAKWTGMRVDEFGIGFPPHLFTYTKGETKYCLNAVPLGGYVKIYGENGHEEQPDPRSFNHRPVWARMLVLVAGVTMNLLFAFIVLCIAYTVGFPSITSDLEKIPGAVVTKSEVFVGGVQSGSPAEKAGIQPGDTIRSFTDPATKTITSVATLAQVQSVTSGAQKGSRQLEVTYTREGKEATVPVTVAESGPALGVEIAASSSVKVPFYRAPQAAVEVIEVIGGSTWGALGGFVKGLFHAELDPTVSGPVGIYKVTSVAAQEGFASVIFLMVALSINLALLNIMPIPVLDGGKLVFLVTELIFRKKVIAAEIESVITSVAFIILIGLITVITLRDLGLF